MHWLRYVKKTFFLAHIECLIRITRTISASTSQYKQKQINSRINEKNQVAKLIAQILQKMTKEKKLVKKKDRKAKS